MTDFERRTKMAEEIGTLRAYVKIAKELIDKADFEEYTFSKIQKEIWLKDVNPLLEEYERQAQEILND